MNKFRFDGSFVIDVNNLPYHVTKSDKLFEVTLVDFNTNPQNFEPEMIDDIHVFKNGNWVDISLTPKYIEMETIKEIIFKKEQLQSQIDELEKSQFRSAKAIFSKQSTVIDTQKYNEYEIQIENLRIQIRQL